ncbi:MAG TPA: arylamine N-acetyltransferase, partial [Blastocatellia bacterium]|nr:arylamine N-acetyltransferase [Blastocatellia bacterium]
MKQKVEKYLDRINYSGSLEPTSETLRALHRAHMFAVPFENLDIHINREIVLDEERILQKIIDERRGGFCYELNGAFAWLLRELGFEVEMLAAGVARA